VTVPISLNLRISSDFIQVVKWSEDFPSSGDRWIAVSLKKFPGNTPIEIKITNCQEPTYERLLRKLDGRFLRALKERMKADPIAPGIPPLALHCISVSTKSDFCHIW
jgi:hypothetical protein